MVYGFMQAVAVVPRLVRPAQANLHERGVKTCMFVDNNNVGGETQEETERVMQLALLVYNLAGWNIKWKMTTTKAEQKIRYLGAGGSGHGAQGVQVTQKQRGQGAGGSAREWTCRSEGREQQRGRQRNC
jgi:hypothetical protein